MALGQLNMKGQTKIDVAIQRLKMYEPQEGYHLAFSGGKDSIVVEQLCKLAGVKFEKHHNFTTVDPPELVYYIRKYHKDAIIHMPTYKKERTTMYKLIETKGCVPTRLMRYCCEVLKEGGGENRFVLTGVRWYESTRRKNSRKMIEHCHKKGKRVLNPIVDWTDHEVWEFIKSENMPYCELYDKGFDRLGCIGCPLQGTKGMERDFKKWPKYYNNYLKAFERMLETRKNNPNMKQKWETAQDVIDWWINQ